MQTNNTYFSYTKYLLAIASIVGGYLALLLLNYMGSYRHSPACVFKLATGIPCPGCGMGRATLELMRGNLTASFNYNILCIPFTIAILVAIGWLLADSLRGKETLFPFLKRDIKMGYKTVLLSVILIDWVTNIVRQV